MEPERVQGVFVKTEEVEAVIHFIKMHTDADMAANMYDMTIVECQRIIDREISMVMAVQMRKMILSSSKL
jgi:hypothetical protein